jgi:hypothetical protein
VAAVLYFSGAGGWLWSRVSKLDEQCYMVLNEYASSIAPPVCQTVASMIEGLDNTGGYIKGQFDGLQDRILGGTGVDRMGRYLESLDFEGLKSSSDDLGRIMAQGPDKLAQMSQGNLSDTFRQSIDSFAIGQNMLTDRATATQALPWLRYGASQPMGYGVMSQLALGNLYIQGAPGVPANPQIAHHYLTQAKGSVEALSGANTQQSQALLKAMGGDPQAVTSQIEHVLRQMKAAQKR